MADILADFSMASMAHAVEANLFAFFQHLRTWPRLELHDDEEYCWTISDLPFPLFNSVMRARLSAANADRAIAARVAGCQQRKVPMLWWTGPSSTPGDLETRLTDHGFIVEPAHGMAMDLREQGIGIREQGSARGLSLAIERVTDRATLDTWTRVLCHSFAAPQAFGRAFADLAMVIGLDDASPFRHYLARVDGEPAATCSLFFGAGVAGIYDVSTLPEHRKQGLGRAITVAALRDARAAGFRMAILHSSTLGLHMYRTLGFTEICPIGQYVWVPEVP